MQKQNISLEAIRIIIREETKDFVKKEDITKFKDQLLTSIDINNKKLDQILSEHPAMNHAIDENREEIEHNDKRIRKLEANSALA